MKKMLLCTLVSLAFLAVHVQSISMPPQDAILVHPDAIVRAADGNTNNDTAFEAIMKINGGNVGRLWSTDGVNLTQGDIVMDDRVRKLLNVSGRQKRAVVKNRGIRWMTNGRPLIPYSIERSAVGITYNIRAAIKHWEQNVPCLKFVPRTSHRSYISFFRGGGCYSYVGRSGGRQRLSLGRGCESLSIAVHEIGHALGFWHEQMRPDRDSYVNIHWRNIPQGVRSNFNKLTTKTINSMGVPYDYNSVMHYSSRAFGNGRITITRKDGSERLGNNRGLSMLDIKQARLLYCGGVSTSTPPTQRPSGCRYRDRHPNCVSWAQRGFCKGSYSQYMSKNCQKSCWCKKVPCRDERTHCRSWASRYCNHTTYKEFMRKYCKKSCRVC